jgi:hypothetical protein
MLWLHFLHDKGSNSSMYMTSSYSSCTMQTALGLVIHRVSRTKPTCYSITSEPTLAKSFHTCSSPATTQTKTHPTPAILGQETVHITLSTTHHECVDNTPLQLRETLHTEHTQMTHKASNHLINHSSYINQDTSQLGFSDRYWIWMKNIMLGFQQYNMIGLAAIC